MVKVQMELDAKLNVLCNEVTLKVFHRNVYPTQSKLIFHWERTTGKTSKENV